MNAPIRPFQADDYPGIVVLFTAVYPDYPQTVEERRFQDERRDPRCKHARWVLAEEGKVVGVGEYGQHAEYYHPRRFWLDVAVLPERQGAGLGAALYRHVMAALEAFEPLGIRSYAREDIARGRRFLEDRGFVEAMREWESRLDVAAFDPAPFAEAEEKVLSQGITVRTAAELAADPDRDRKLWELEWQIMQDAPSDSPATQISLEHFQRTRLDGPNFLPDAYFVALDGGDYVGMSVLSAVAGGEELDTGWTGVRRDHRRRGIALALKLRTIAYALAHGHRQIKTWNATTNRGMLGINERLGFTRQPAWIDYVKPVREEQAV